MKIPEWFYVGASRFLDTNNQQVVREWSQKVAAGENPANPTLCEVLRGLLKMQYGILHPFLKEEWMKTGYRRKT